MWTMAPKKNKATKIPSINSEDDSKMVFPKNTFIPGRCANFYSLQEEGFHIKYPFKHEFVEIKRKIEHINLDWYTIRHMHKLKAYCFGLELDENPLTDRVHHETRRCYQTLNHTCFTQETPFNMIYSWKKEFYVECDHNFSFIVHLPYSKILLHSSCATNHWRRRPWVCNWGIWPPPSRAYDQCVKVELLRTCEALPQALEDR